MGETQMVRAAEIQLLKKEIEVQGELLSAEQGERRAEVDQLRLEIETLKKLMDRMSPGFLKEYEKFYREERQRFNPELGKDLEADQEIA
jgi:hypothetical protein